MSSTKMSSGWRNFCAWTACLLFVFSSLPVWSQEVAPSGDTSTNSAATVGPTPDSAGATTAATAAVNHVSVPIPANAVLDLGSTVQSIAAPNSAPVNINVGGTTQTINPGQMLTPAQFLAVRQVVGNWGKISF